jgi:hypothetical protein
MKAPTLFFVLFLALSFSCNAQLNKLTVEELAQIKFNEFTLSQIRRINAQDTKAEELFGKGNFESALNESCPFYCKDFWNKDLYFGFEEISQADQQYYLSYLTVINTSVKVSIKDVQIALGDKIDVFQEKGYLISEENNWVVFVDEETSTIDIAFYFDPSTRLVNKINMNTY